MAKTMGPYLDLIISADLGEEWYDELKKFLRWANVLMGLPYIGTSVVYGPPGSPVDGECCLLGDALAEGGSPLTGVFNGHNNEIAIWSADADAWEFIVPTANMKVGANTYVTGWNNVYWVDPGGGG